jgi:hypothetical protein
MYKNSTRNLHLQIPSKISSIRRDAPNPNIFIYCFYLHLSKKKCKKNNQKQKKSKTKKKKTRKNNKKKSIKNNHIKKIDGKDDRTSVPYRLSPTELITRQRLRCTHKTKLNN